MAYKDKAKMAEYRRLWMKKRRWQWVAANGPCQFCGDTRDLKLSCIDEEKRIVPSGTTFWSFSKERRDAILENFRVLCRSCNAMWANNPVVDVGRILHGMYEQGYKRGCRCAACMQIASQHEWPTTPYKVKRQRNGSSTDEPVPKRHGQRVTKAPKYNFGVREAEKTHCPKGHPYSGSNLMFVQDGRRKNKSRRCRICRIDAVHRSREKKKSAAIV